MSAVYLLNRLMRANPVPTVSNSQAHKLGTTPVGTLMPKPHIAHSFGTLRIILWSVPFVYAGAMAAKYMASSLEEFDLFVPDDDDD